MPQYAPDPRGYELMTILSPEVPEDEIPGILDGISGYITTAGGTVSEVLRESPWGRRRLAYPIRHEGRDLRDGFYTVYHFELIPGRVTEVERDLKLNTAVIRHLVTHYKPKPLDRKAIEEAEIDAEDAAAAAYAAAQAAQREGAAPSGDAATTAVAPAAAATNTAAATDAAGPAEAASDQTAETVTTAPAPTEIAATAEVVSVAPTPDPVAEAPVADTPSTDEPAAAGNEAANDSEAPAGDPSAPAGETLGTVEDAPAADGDDPSTATTPREGGS